MNAKSGLILGMCCIYMIQFFAQSEILILLLSAFSVAMFFVSLPNANLVPRIFGIVMFVSGMTLNFVKGRGFEDTANGVITNAPMLTLVFLVPLLAIPLKMEGYFDSIRFFMRKWIMYPKKLFSSISIFVFCMGPILNLGSIRILHEMIKDLRLNPILISRSELVGFSTVILWSPYFASVALVLYNLHVPVVDYLPLGLSLAASQLIIGNLLFRKWQSKKGPVGTVEFDENKVDSKDVVNHRNNIKKLLIFVIFLMSSILIFEQVTGWSMMYVVSLISIFYPVFWCAYKRKWRAASTHFKDFRSQTVRTMNNDIVLFISSGLFGKSLTGTAFADGIRLFLNQISAASFLLFIVTVIAIILVFSFVGVHQIVVVTALVTQMDPVIIGTEPEVLALLLMVSWSVSAVLSPVNPLNLLVSGYVQQPALAVGLKWNGTYLLTMLITGVLFVYLIH